MLAKAVVFLVQASCLVAYGYSFQINMKLSPFPSRSSIGSFNRASGHCNCPAATLDASASFRHRHLSYPLRMSAVLEGEKNAVSTPVNNIKYLTKEEAKQIDAELMSDDGGFSLSTLMELAGKSVADVIYDAYPPERIGKDKIVIICGKGNNGGDGLVAARHLHYYGYEVEVVYPQRAPREPFIGYVKQLKNLDVRVNMGMPGTANRLGLIVDAIFGFSYEAPLKAPWDLILKQLNSPDYFGGIPVLSVDIPTGWDVEKGPPKDGSYSVSPDILVSLSSPKLCSTRFDGVHYLAGRFIPSRMQYKYKLNLPKYEGAKSFTMMPPPPPVVEEEEQAQEPSASGAQAAAAQSSAAEAARPLVNPLLGLNAMVSSLPDQPAAAAAAAAAAVPAAPAAAAAAAAAVPGSFEADPQIKEAIDAAAQQVIALLQEQKEGWATEVRKVISPRLVPLGWSSNYPPDRTTVAKLCFVAAKALREAGADNFDVLAEGRALAESAFAENGEVGAGRVLRGLAMLYGKGGDSETRQLVLEGVDRVIAERGLLPDLEEPPARPLYGYGDKWTVSLRGPERFGPETVDVVVRPTQQARLLLKAWAQATGVEPEGYSLVVPRTKTAWRWGPVDLLEAIGETGLVNLATLDIVDAQQQPQ